MTAVDIGDHRRPGLWASVPIALAAWTRRQWMAAIGATVALGLAIGLSTVLIPNRIFGREIASVTWNYPVWVIISILSGMLAATYVAPTTPDEASPTGAAAGVGGASVVGRASVVGVVGDITGPTGAAGKADAISPTGVAGMPDMSTEPALTDPGLPATLDLLPTVEETRSARLGSVGAVLGWFAVGCPVCNKIALVALGYSGAMQWFAPAQPFLAAAAIALSSLALAMRLRGQVWCPIPRL